MCQNFSAGNNRLTFQGKDYFIFGVNLLWLNYNYFSVDFGNNEVIGAGPPWYNPDTTSEIVSEYLEDIDNIGIRMLRIWVFEDYEGLKFNAGGYVTNVDPQMFINIDDFIERAKSENFYIYWCMTDYLAYDWRPQAWKYLNIITNKIARGYYITNALMPFVLRYKEHPTFFAIDIMNEPEFVIAGDTGNWTTNGTTWDVMRSFIADCVSAIKSIDPNILVSCGSVWHNEENVKAGRFSGLGLDFYDIHIYNNTGNLPDLDSLNVDRPVLIGECGQSHSSGWNDTIQDNVIKNIIQNAHNYDYAGVLPIHYEYPPGRADNIWSFLNSDGSWRPVCYSMKEFALKYCKEININGKLVSTLIEKKFYTGNSKLDFKISDWKDKIFSGIYIISVKFGNSPKLLKTIGVI